MIEEVLFKTLPTPTFSTQVSFLVARLVDSLLYFFAQLQPKLKGFFMPLKVASISSSS